MFSDATFGSRGYSAAIASEETSGYATSVVSWCDSIQSVSTSTVAAVMELVISQRLAWSGPG